jgi:hypothetical protein
VRSSNPDSYYLTRDKSVCIWSAVDLAQGYLRSSGRGFAG